MSTAAPSTPDNTPRKVALNRSFTLPTKAATSSRTNPTAEIGAAEGIETLYVHPNGKVIKFTAASASRPGSSAGTPSPGGAGSGKLPWATLTEQTLAAGPLEIYRVPGSVSFLHSGALLHAILPRSNCWCVDGVSKFAMRVLPDTYYRIEIPGETPEDLEKAEELKETLKKVLYYERTPCPFARTFTVELPEPEVKKTRRRRSHGVARKWKLDRAYSWKPEDGVEPQRRGSEESSGSLTGSDEECSSSGEDARSTASPTRVAVPSASIRTPARLSVKERAQGFNLRSVTAPVTMQSTAPSSRLRSSIAATDNTSPTRSREEPMSPGQSVQSADTEVDHAGLRVFQSIPTDMPPSPPDSSAGLEFNTEHPSRATLPDLSSTPFAVDLEHSEPNANVHMSENTPSELSILDAALGKSSLDEAAGERELAPADELDAKPNAPSNLEAHADASTSISSTHTATTNTGEIFVTADGGEPEHAERGAHESLHESEIFGCPTINDDDHSALLVTDTPQYDGLEGDVATSDTEIKPDPYAQIQARIQARRSIGGTTSFHPTRRSPTRQSTSSTASSASLSSTRSALSRRSHSSQPQQQALAAALVRKACAVFLGPPASLVALMLRIAARFAKGAFPASLMFESPANMTKRVPGSFDLDGSDLEEFDIDDGDWEEDDFGVPLRSPIRLAAMRRGSSTALDDSPLRERKPRVDVGLG